MPWGKLDDKFHRHPKIRRAIKLGGLAAVGLHVLALSFCNDESTDGFVPADFVGRHTRLAQALVEATNPMKPEEPGLWEPVDGGWCIHDFLKHNPSATAVKEKREEARVRVNNARTVRKQRANSTRTASEHSRSSQSVRSTPVPVPVPSPVPDQNNSPPTPRRRRDVSALDMARASKASARDEAAVRLVELASERFSWRLTKTRTAEELRFAGELLDLWDEATITQALSLRRKLSSLRWLADFIPTMNGAGVAPRHKDRPAILDEPDPVWDGDETLATENRADIAEILS